MRRRGAVLAKRGRGRGPRLPRLWMVGLISLTLALGVVVWKQRHRFLESVAPKAPSILVDVDKDKPVLIKVFFGSPKRQRLEAEARTIYASAHRDAQVKQAILELLKGPRSSLVAVIPTGTRLNELYIDKDGTAYVDLSDEVATRHPGGVLAERLTIGALVNTLMYNFPEITAVRLFTDGEQRDTLAGHVRTSGRLGRDRDLVVRR
ncbi:MAG: GerMN domain-containing protein [bacterium]|nr:GerMN domain-containing protein [bacterium]